MSNRLEKKKIMEEALELQAEWEKCLLKITRGRQYDELTQDEQERFLQISKEYNERIDEKLETIYPDLREEKR